MNSMSFNSMDTLQNFKSPVTNSDNNQFSPIAYKQSRNQETVNQYLPGYLLGNSPNAASSSGRSFSSTSNFHRVKDNALKWRSAPRSQTSLQTSPMEQQNSKISPQKRSYYSRLHPSMKNNPEAPPTESLFSPTKGTENKMEMDTIIKDNSWVAPSPISVKTHTPLARKESVSSKSFMDHREDYVTHSPAQIDPFYTQGENITSNDILDDTAVTVFGFPPAMSSYILQQFAQYGKIDKYEIHNTGNWLHIKFQTKIQAKKALSKNGKIISQVIMVGVLPCIKEDFGTLKDSAEMLPNNNVSLTPDHRKHPLIRPLTVPTPNTIGSMDNFSPNALSNEIRAPNKKNSVVSKVADYVFGW